MEVKVEPTLQCYVEEEHENNFSILESTNVMPSSIDASALQLWTSKATACLISQYKKYRSLVGQSTQIRSLREMFEMVSIEMQHNGFFFSPQKCENKWRVLERKYKNLVFRERLKKPGRMRHYGQWEHKRALDEIFNEKKKHVYLEVNDQQPPSGAARYPFRLQKHGCDKGNDSPDDRQSEDPLATASNEKDSDMSDYKQILTTSFERFMEQMMKNFEKAEKNKEKRHKEKMALKNKKLELKKQLVKLKEQKMELQRCQIIAAAQSFHSNIN